MQVIIKNILQPGQLLGSLTATACSLLAMLFQGDTDPLPTSRAPPFALPMLLSAACYAGAAWTLRQHPAMPGRSGKEDDADNVPLGARRSRDVVVAVAAAKAARGSGEARAGHQRVCGAQRVCDDLCVVICECGDVCVLMWASRYRSHTFNKWQPSISLCHSIIISSSLRAPVMSQGVLHWRALVLQVARAWQAAKEGMVLVAASGYLRALCGFMLLQYVCSSLFYFEKSLVVAAAGQDAAHRTAFFGAINSASALCILVLQLLVTGAGLSTRQTCCTPTSAVLHDKRVFGKLPVLTVVHQGASSQHWALLQRCCWRRAGQWPAWR